MSLREILAAGEGPLEDNIVIRCSTILRTYGREVGLEKPLVIRCSRNAKFLLGNVVLCRQHYERNKR